MVGNNYLATYELVNLCRNLKRLQGKDMTGSGIRITLEELNGQEMGEMEFMGEYLPELIPVLLKSLEETLELRAARARNDITSIKTVLGKE